MSVPEPRPIRRHLRATVGVAAAASAVGLTAYAAIGGSALAGSTAPDRQVEVTLTFAPITAFTLPPVVTLLPPLTIGTVPFTIPPFTVVTLLPPLTLPPFTVAPPPTDATTTVPPTDPPTTPATTSATTPAPTAAPTPAPTDDATESSPASSETAVVPPHLEITAASVDCAGVLHVEYFTEAEPEPAESTSHLIVVNPLSNPAAIAAQELTDRPTNGQFVLDLQAPAAEGYRVVVVGDFEPDNVDGVLLVDEAEALLGGDCLTSTTETG